MTFARLAQRVYERSALEAHFESFDFNWESKFSKDELRAGRKLYCAGAVRVLELHENIAIVCLKLSDGTEPYCVIDFAGKLFTVRTLGGDDRTAAPYAIAGLYEIEELLADELTPLKYERSSSVKVEAFEPPEKKYAPPDIPSPPMKMLLSFRLKRDALIFESSWKTGQGLHSAFGENSLNASALTHGEREQLVRIASFARKAGFRYGAKNYQCSDPAKISQFISSTIKDWSKYFEIQKSDDLKLISRGVRKINLKANISADGEDGIHADFYADLDGEKVGLSELRRLKGWGGRSRILNKRGLVQISESDESLLVSAERSLADFGDKIPRYMMFTLFEDFKKISISDDLKEWKNRVFAPQEIPANLGFLREYQRIGVSRMLSLFKGGCGILLADEMGLGKTVQALSAISSFWDGQASFLIVCPASVIPVWIGEAQKFFPHMKCKVLDSGAKLDAKEGGALWLASYTQLRRNRSKLDAVQFKVAVLDEAQFIKNPDAKVSEACMAIRADCKIALSGTPMENRLLDIWTIFRWLMPGLMGRRGDFEHKLNADPNFASKIRRQIAPFVLRRLKNEVAKELPAKNLLDLPCPMTPMQSAEYAKLIDNARSLVKNGAISQASGRISILSLLTRLRQTACDPALLPWIGDCDVSNSGKITVLSEALYSIISNGRKAVVFSQFTSFIARMRGKVEKDFPDAKISELTGSTRDRSEPVAQFQSAEGAAVIFVSLRAGGTGITLTGADYVFLADPWWNPAVENQAIDRVHRIGKENEVFVYRLISGSTVEERVRKLQERKNALFEDIFGSLAHGGRTFEESVMEILDL